MQDLFRLGTLIQGSRSSSEPGRSARRPSRPAHDDEASAPPSFDALLAIAATMPDNHHDRPVRKATTGNVGTREPGASGAPEKTASGDTSEAGIRDLLGPYAKQATTAAPSDAPRTSATGSTADGAANLEITASQTPPASTSYWERRQNGERVRFDTDVSVPSDQAEPMNGFDEGEPAITGDQRTAMDFERVLRWQTEPVIDPDGAGSVDSRYDDGGLTVPDLQVVARNDNPVSIRTLDAARPNLHLIEDGQTEEDLVDRLAGTWEQSFVPEDDADMTANEPTSQITETFVNRMAFEASGPQVAAAATGIRLIDPHDERAPVGSTDEQSSDEPVEDDNGVDSALIDGFSEIDAAAWDNLDVVATDASVTTGRHWDRRASVEDSPENASASPVSLFGKLLSREVDSATGTAPEPAASVREAVMEVTHELQRLEDAGGNELSFSLRLHPEHLGEVEVEIQRVNDVWSISIVTANKEARDALAAEINRLEHRFREHQLNLDGVTVVTRAAENSITAPAATEQPASTGSQYMGHSDLTHGQNQDESGWRNPGATTILGIDSSQDVGTEQDVTRRHRSTAQSGIDIKA